MPSTLFQKVWDQHAVRKLPNGQTQLFIGLHLIHEVTSPQAFDMLRARGWTVKFPDRTIATVDHIVPTRDQRRPFMDVMAEDMLAALERNVREAGVRFFDLGSGAQGIVHVSDRADDDGRADDDLQHVDRGWRAGGVCEPG
jgi:3-isopropylmalate/(R)-2-methylmalate dehydratase large subunit